jgi:hypothetical protein
MICTSLFCESIELARKSILFNLSTPLSGIKLLETLSKGCKLTAAQFLRILAHRVHFRLGQKVPEPPGLSRPPIHSLNFAASRKSVWAIRVFLSNSHFD